MDEKTIEHLTRLSRIKCSKDEIVALTKNLKDILGYVEHLNEVDTENMAPCNHILQEMRGAVREDVVADLLPRELFLENAPAHIGGMIRVPPVLKGA